LSLNSKFRILISGGGGYFASHIKRLAVNHVVYAPTKKEMDVRNLDSVTWAVESYQPDIFIHAAALTRPMIKHVNNPAESITCNIIGTSNVVLTCMQNNVKLVYISTDYVYPGTDGNYSETDSLLPFTNYGWSKLGGECAVSLYENSLILRIGMTNRPFCHPRALVDVKKSLLFDDEAAKITLSLLNEKGIINVGGKAQSIYDFVSSHNTTIGKISKSEVNDVEIAVDTSMNTEKMEGILNDKSF